MSRHPPPVRLATAAASVLLAAAAAPSRAAPVVWNAGAGGNGNTYDVISAPDLSWDEARAAAQAAGGDLATIQSQAEQDFVESVLTANNALTGAYWFGLRETTEGVYHHVDGSALGYANWANQQPDNAGGVETSGQVLWTDPDLPMPEPGALARSGMWNDAPAAGFVGGVDEVPSDAFRSGYLVEIADDGNGGGPPAVVPLPAAAYAFPAGAAAVALFHRRFRRR